MQIQIESTGKTTSVDGVPVRVWEGITAAGVPCKVLIHRIVVEVGREEEFERELIECATPAEMQNQQRRVFDLRSIL